MPDADRADQVLVGGDSARPSIALREWVEGWEKVRLAPYDDGSGYMTIGCGHRMQDSDPRVPITQAECDALLDGDLLYYSDGVNRLITWPRRQWQHDALVAFAMNCGLGALTVSKLRARMNEGDVATAAELFAPWNKSRDKATGELVVNRGLVKRRAAERAMFVDGNYACRP